MKFKTFFPVFSWILLLAILGGLHLSCEKTTEPCTPSPPESSPSPETPPTMAIEPATTAPGPVSSTGSPEPVTSQTGPNPQAPTTAGPLDNPIFSRSQAAPEGVEEVTVALDALGWANIAYNAPSIMTLGEPSIVELVLSVEKPTAKLTGQITAKGRIESDRIQVSDRMKAALFFTGGSPVPLTPEEQLVGSRGISQWSWAVAPTRSGRHQLVLSLTARVSVKGQPGEKNIKSFRKVIDVRVTLGYRVGEFLGNNWQWLWAVIVTPIAGWLYQHFRKKRRAAHH